MTALVDRIAGTARRGTIRSAATGVEHRRLDGGIDRDLARYARTERIQDRAAGFRAEHSIDVGRRRRRLPPHQRLDRLVPALVGREQQGVLPSIDVFAQMLLDCGHQVGRDRDLTPPGAKLPSLANRSPACRWTTIKPTRRASRDSPAWRESPRQPERRGACH